jgi:hypothetical protein
VNPVKDVLITASVTKVNYSKKIQVSERFDYFREESRKNIVSEKGIQLRINRSIQAEGVFGITKQDYGFKRFLMRGARKRPYRISYSGDSLRSEQTSLQDSK